LQPVYRSIFTIPKEYKEIVKAADRIAALQKCREEIASGNPEFERAAKRIEEVLKSSALPELDYFLNNFVPEKPMSLDSLIEGNGAWLLEDSNDTSNNS
jgi:5'-deoxynucleotidase